MPQKETPSTCDARGGDDAGHVGPTVIAGPENASEALALATEHCRLLVVVPSPEGKLLLPVDPAAKLDFAALLLAHEAGGLPPLPCLTEDGRRWTERRGIALAARPGNDDGMAAWVGLDFDAAGPGHAGGAPVAAVCDAADVAHGLLVAAGLSSILCRSPGLRGRHVWCVLPAPIHPEAATWIAEIIAAEVIAAVPEAAPGIEIRPAAGRWPGQPLTLPTKARIIADHWPNKRDALAALDRLLLARERAAAVEAKQREIAAAERKARAARAPKSGDINSADVGLAEVAEVAGEIVRERGAEIHVRCPACGGTVKINPRKHAWSCFQCSTGGVGDAASYLLARWLSPDATAAEVFDILRQAAGERITP